MGGAKEARDPTTSPAAASTGSFQIEVRRGREEGVVVEQVEGAEAEGREVAVAVAVGERRRPLRGRVEGELGRARCASRRASGLKSTVMAPAPAWRATARVAGLEQLDRQQQQVQPGLVAGLDMETLALGLSVTQVWSREPHSRYDLG